MKRYAPRQRPVRQHLRTHGTPAEVRLWTALKGRRLRGRQFRRQYGIGPYVLDFCCPAERLAVELDGAVHDSPQARAYDTARTEALEAEGLRVVRFENKLVFDNLDGVLAAIAGCFSDEGESAG
ncbi:endonuclease domain-containing protein [Rubrivirga sp.]|uniref:endonuclease domain-containing protein n=1 Tax=Rubrivirga sp. TaxID=1885344 RepID=UPI003B519E8B